MNIEKKNLSASLHSAHRWKNCCCCLDFAGESKNKIVANLNYVTSVAQVSLIQRVQAKCPSAPLSLPVWALNELENNVNFGRKIIFSDEDRFDLRCNVKNLKYRFRGCENPIVVVEKSIHPQRMTVCLGFEVVPSLIPKTQILSAYGVMWSRAQLIVTSRVVRVIFFHIYWYGRDLLFRSISEWHFFLWQWSLRLQWTECPAETGKLTSCGRNGLFGLRRALSPAGWCKVPNLPSKNRSFALQVRYSCNHSFGRCDLITSCDSDGNC